MLIYINIVKLLVLQKAQGDGEADLPVSYSFSTIIQICGDLPIILLLVKLGESLLY